MDVRLTKLVDRVRSTQVQSNPADEDDVVIDSGWLLQLELLRSGLDLDFSEDELYEALQSLGVPEDDIPSWFEDLASYIA
jgi:hypothetical protein